MGMMVRHNLLKFMHLISEMGTASIPMGYPSFPISLLASDYSVKCPEVYVLIKT